MKHPFSYILGALLLPLLSSCSSDDNVADSNGVTEVTFGIQAEGTEQAAMTRAFDAPQNILVLDCYGSSVTEKEFSDLTAVALPLEHGVHDLYFVAATKKWSACSGSSLTVSWPSDTNGLNKVWGLHYQLTVTEETTFEELLLPLVVAGIQIVTYDKLPATAATVEIEGPDMCTVLDVKTMQAAASGNEGLNYELNVATAAGVSTMSVMTYSFVPSSGSVGDIVITVKNASDTEISSKTFSSVPVAAGELTYYSGYFFSDGISVPLSYATDWSKTNAISY